MSAERKGKQAPTKSAGRRPTVSPRAPPRRAASGAVLKAIRRIVAVVRPSRWSGVIRCETPQAGTPDPIVSDKGTPLLSKAAPIDLPEPSDCKVEPLSVDDVLAIVDDPDIAERTPIYVIEDRASPPPGGWSTDGPGYNLLN